MVNDKNPDIELIHRPVSDEELSAYKNFAREVAQQNSRTFAQQQVDDYRQMAATCLRGLESHMPDSVQLELRKSAAQGIAKGYGQLEQAFSLAPEIALELRGLAAAIENSGALRCSCGRDFADADMVEHVFSTPHRRIVHLVRCAECGDQSVR